MYPLFSTCLVIIAGVRSYIWTVPEGPIFQAGTDVWYYCKVTAPGSFTYTFKVYCLSGGHEQLALQLPLSTDTERSAYINSTPINNNCLDIKECIAWDESGTVGKDRLYSQVTGEFG